MGRYILRRLGQMIPVLFLASIAIWAMAFLLPGNPAVVLGGPNATPADLARIEARLGLNKPVVEQYWIWIHNVLTGNLGTSFRGDQAQVRELIFQRVPATAQLALCSMVIGLVLATIVGTASALRPRSIAGRLATAYQNIVLAIPTFWLAVLLLLLFAIHWHVFPAGSDFIPIWHNPAQGLRIIALPALTLGLHVSSIVSRFIRTSLSDTMTADYVRTARSKGAFESVVIRDHAARNALLPVVTIVGLQLANFLGGTVVVESIFNYPGLGSLILNAVQARDYAVIQGSLLFVVFVFLMINLMVDLLYAYIDPRVKLTTGAV